MAVETFLATKLAWVIAAAAGGLVEGRAEEAFQRAQRSLRERLPTLLGRPEGADLVRGVRRAQFRALDQLVRDYQETAILGRLAAPDSFVERALAWCHESLRLAAYFTPSDVTEPGATRAVSSALAGTDKSYSALDGIEAVENGVLSELRAALESGSLPPAFETHFRDGGRGRRRFMELFRHYTEEEINENAAFREILNVHLHLQTLDAVGGVAGTLEGIKAAQEEMLRVMSAEKGIPMAPLRQILARLGELDVPFERIVERLDAAASDYLSLRERWSQIVENAPDVTEVKARALALIDAGDFDGARRLFEEARAKVRAARHGRTREEASLLAGEAEMARLELRYRDAGERFAQAASLVRAFDPDAGFSYLWERADTYHRLGEEFGDNSALLNAITGWRQLLTLSPRRSKPLRWAATQSNLGNSLFRLGERESGTARLKAAVAAFQAALKERIRERVPLDWARTQNNLGNALSRLGGRESGTVRLEEAVVAFRAALEERTRELVPFDWAATQNNLANTLTSLGERESGTWRLEEAVAAYQAALEVYRRDRVPLIWAGVQNNLGTVLSRLGERESGTARLEEAVTTFRAALEERTRERVPLDWATTQNNLGSVLGTLGERETGTARLEEAVTAFRAALEERTRERVPLDWAVTQNNLGAALYRLGERESGTVRLEEAVTAFRAALEERTRERVPLDWATTQNNLGVALQRLGEREKGTARLKEAAAAFRAALEENTRDRVPLDWAMIQNNLGNALRGLGERERGTERLEEAVEVYRAALETLLEAGADHFASIVLHNAELALKLLDERLGG